MLLVWQSYGLVYSRMQWTMQTLIFLDFFFSLFPSVNCCFTALSHTSLRFDFDKYEKAASQKSFRGIILMFGLMG